MASCVEHDTGFLTWTGRFGDDAMTSSTLDLVESKSLPNIELLPKDRTILEQGAMVFRPFGLDEQGHTIRDLSGVSIRAVTVFLEKLVASGR